MISDPVVQSPVYAGYSNSVVASPVYDVAPISADCCTGEVVESTTTGFGEVNAIDGANNWAPTEARPTEAKPTEAAPAGGGEKAPDYQPADGARSSAGNAGMLAIKVDPEAVVYVNDYKTTSKGTERRFLSSGLQSGLSYTYEVRAEKNGQAITKFVALVAGERADLEFKFPEQPRSETVLALYVPEDAVVKLAGSDTRMSGTRRVFATNRLAKGQAWEDYTVQVSVNQDGRVVTKERTLTVRSGETYELRFDFNDSQVASR